MIDWQKISRLSRFKNKVGIDLAIAKCKDIENLTYEELEKIANDCLVEEVAEDFIDEVCNEIEISDPQYQSVLEEAISEVAYKINNPNPNDEIRDVRKWLRSLSERALANE